MRTLYALAIAALLSSCADDPETKPPVDADVGTVQDSGAADMGAEDAGSTSDMSVEADMNAEVDMGPDMAEPNPCGFRAPSTLGIYAGVGDLEGESLRTELAGIVGPHRGLTYDDARTRMYVSPGLDVSDDDGLIECIYTGVRIAPDGTRSPSDGNEQITTEHSWPRNEGAEFFPAEGDLHHLFPATAGSNNRRGVHPFGITNCDDAGEAACTWAEGGSQLGEGISGQPFVFEVRPEFRGEIARAHFYFAVRYDLQIPPLEEAVLRDWHCEDPPDLRELIRNDLVENEQQNRNPFVDRPRLVERIEDF